MGERPRHPVIGPVLYSNAQGAATRAFAEQVRRMRKQQSTKQHQAASKNTWAAQRSEQEAIEEAKRLDREATKRWKAQQKAKVAAARAAQATQPAPTTIREGRDVVTRSKRYERNSAARRLCIERHGTDCSVCGFDFGAVYGELGEGFIHVHHLNPVAEQGGEHELDPVNDLRPVCPNCHAMLHKGGVTRSIGELRATINK